MNRKPIFDAIKAARGGKQFLVDDVREIDALLTQLGIPGDGPAAPVEGKMHITDKGIALIKEYEGLSLKAYRDTGGVWTIGVGHTRTAKAGMVITEAQADDLLREDLREAEDGVRKLFPATTQAQFDALTSFVFNLGEGQVQDSTLRRLHNEGQYEAAAAQFSRWVYDNGVKLTGLVRRRAAEAKLYRGQP